MASSSAFACLATGRRPGCFTFTAPNRRMFGCTFIGDDLDHCFGSDQFVLEQVPLMRFWKSWEAL